jgi:hypothetical protein
MLLPKTVSSVLCGNKPTAVLYKFGDYCSRSCVAWNSTPKVTYTYTHTMYPHHVPTPYTHTIYPHHIPTTYTHTIYPHHIPTTERYKFFCCSKQHACGIGSGPRQGHSALRPCTPHDSRDDLTVKRAAAADPASPNFKEACESLKRRGIDPLRECTALAGRTGCLLYWPGRIHFGLFGYDVLHILYTGAIGYLLEAVLDTMTPTAKGVLDSRVLKLGSFRKDSGYIICSYIHTIHPHHIPTSYTHIIYAALSTA